MKTLFNSSVRFFSIPLLVLLAPLVWADGDGLDVTITVVGEDETPEETFEIITLPEVVSGTAVVKSQKGLDTANAAQENGKAFGQSKAEEAKHKGEAAKNNAKNAVENASSQNQENIKDSVSSRIPEVAQDHIPQDVLDAINKDRKPELPPRERGNGNN